MQTAPQGLKLFQDRPQTRPTSSAASKKLEARARLIHQSETTERVFEEQLRAPAGFG